MKPRQGSRDRKKGKYLSEDAKVAKLYKNIKGEKLIYERWMAGAESVLSTGAGGTVALTTLANAASVSSAPDFASAAVLYTTYRVKAIRVQLLPILNTSVYNGAGITTPPSVIAVYPCAANSVPTTFAQALDCSGLKLMSGYKGGICQTSWIGDPDAHLWTGTGSAIGSNEQFLISCIGTSTAAAANSGVFKVLPFYLVQFRMVG